ARMSRGLARTGLIQDGGLERRWTRPAPGGLRPPDADEAPVVETACPFLVGPDPLLSLRFDPVRRPPACGDVLREPRAHVRSERCFVGRVAEVHGEREVYRGPLVCQAERP